MRPNFKPLLAVLAILASCGVNTPVSYVSYSPSYNPGEELYAGNQVPVVIRGNPFAIPQPEFDSATLAAMQGWAFRPAQFVPAIDPNAVYRVVLIFYPPGNTTGTILCQRPLTANAAFGLPPAPQAPFSAALCRGDASLADVFGRIGTEGGPGGAPFRRGVGQVIASLFPPQNPQNRPDQCSGVDC